MFIKSFDFEKNDCFNWIREKSLKITIFPKIKKILGAIISDLKYFFIAVEKSYLKNYNISQNETNVGPTISDCMK